MNSEIGNGYLESYFDISFTQANSLFVRLQPVALWHFGLYDPAVILRVQRMIHK